MYMILSYSWIMYSFFLQLDHVYYILTAGPYTLYSLYTWIMYTIFSFNWILHTFSYSQIRILYTVFFLQLDQVHYSLTAGQCTLYSLTPGSCTLYSLSSESCTLFLQLDQVHYYLKLDHVHYICLPVDHVHYSLTAGQCTLYSLPLG